MMNTIHMESGTTQKLKILYVGDDQHFIPELKTEPSVEIISWENGLQAINWLTNHQIDAFNLNHEANEANAIHYQQVDAILCSLYLPGMNAFDFFREVKNISFFSHTPFILLTQKFSFTIRDLALQHGIDDFYILPVPTDHIIDRIHFLHEFKKYQAEKSIEAAISDKPYRTALIKRTFDVLSAGTALLLLSPLLLLVALAIRMESKGKVYYISKRIGANFKEFDFYKFRSMYPDADKRLKEVEHLNQYKDNEVELFCTECAKLPQGSYCSPVVFYDNERICERMYIIRKNAKKAFLKIPNDPRITKVGNFIRNTSIDELPQLINVIKGDMSIVGNRPLPVNEANAITKSIWARRFRAAAGLTGLWQVELRGKGGFMSEEERFRLDVKYAENNTFWGDINLIFRTFKIFVQRENV